MPKRTDISSILVIGAGPIVIGQACEFDYSGTQAIKALKEEGYRIVLVNSNPATIMTDPELADATYVEPITPEIVAKIIEKERPDAVLPTMGGQTALNTALALFHDGTLDKFGVKMIGADAEAIDKAEDRIKFRNAMDKIGLESARSGIAHSLEEALEVLERTGLPSIIRPSFTMGGTGGGVAYNREEFIQIVTGGLDASPRGDPAGFVQLLDDKTLLLPERRGNNRADSLRNIVADPRVALLFLIPGVGETLRVNGHARISVAPDLLARFVVNGQPPKCVIVVDVQAVYFQCARAIQRSRLWDAVPPGTPRPVPTPGAILASITQGAFDGAAYDRELPARQQATLY